MNEQQIAQKVAQNIPQEPVASEPTVEATEAPAEQPFSWNGEIDTNSFMILADAFNLDRISRHTEATQLQMRAIYRYAAESVKSTDVNLILGKISEMENQLGIGWRSDKMQRLARWVHLEKQTEVLRRQQEFITNG